MQNILLSGFEEQPNEGAVVGDNKITTKLGDLGIVMEPAKGLVQPIIYRAPEVYFRNEISPAADIWSWGLIYCQLLEAQASFNKYGLYDELLQGNQVQKERSVERAIAHDFGLGALDYYDGCRLPYRDNTHYEGQQWDRIVEKGVPEKEIQFLKWVLNPVPTDRPSAQEILESGWFTTDDEATGRIAKTLKTRAEESRRKNLHRKRSEPLLSSMSVQQPVKNTQVPLDVAASTTLPSTPMPQPQANEQPQQQQQPVSYQPMSFQPVESTQYSSRPAAPRSSTQRPAGGTFMNYGSFMR
jgi:protein kinase